MLNVAIEPYCVRSEQKAPPHARFAIRYQNIPHLRAQEHMTGTWEQEQFKFTSKFVQVTANKTQDVQRVYICGIMHTLPVYEASYTCAKIPPIYSTSRYYNDVENILLRKTIHNILTTQPMTTGKIRQHLDRICHNDGPINLQIPKSKTEKYLCMHLAWLQKHGLAKCKRPKHRKRTKTAQQTTWYRTSKPHAFVYDRDEYIAYHGCWSYLRMLIQYGMHISKRNVCKGLANAISNTLHKKEETMRTWKQYLGPEHDECRAGDVVLQWIENAPWNTDQPQYIQPIQGTEILRSNGNIGLCMGETDTFLEVWDGTQKIGDVWPVLPTTAVDLIRAAEKFLYAHLIYPYDGIVQIGEPVILFKNINHWKPPHEVGAYVWDGQEIRIVTSIQGDHVQLCSMGTNRRTIKKPIHIDKVKPAHIHYTYAAPDAQTVHGIFPDTCEDMCRVRCTWKREFHQQHVRYILISYRM